MRLTHTLAATAAIIALVGASMAASAATFSDTFEGGVLTPPWYAWSGSNQSVLQTSSSHNITPGGSQSALAVQADPEAYSGTANFGSTNGSVDASVWVFEDFTNNGTNSAQPVTDMLCLIGDNGTSTPGFQTDYLQLGVVPFWPGGSTTYGWRSKYGDANQGGAQSVGVSRKAGWTHLEIQADSLALGGQVRFFIDGSQVGTTQRSANYLKWVRLGNNSKTYENFWYDDVTVVPEPGSLLALGGALLSFAGVIRKRRI